MLPPLHPAIVHFPIALVTLSVVADLFGYFYQSETLKGAGWWALLGAAIGGALAAIAGYTDMKREEIEPTAHQRVHTHMRTGIFLLALIVGLTVWRWAIYSYAEYEIGWLYLIAAVAVLAVTSFQGWLGGELVYGYGVGVAPTGQGTEPVEAAKDRVKTVIGKAESHQH